MKLKPQETQKMFAYAKSHSKRGCNDFIAPRSGRRYDVWYDTYHHDCVIFTGRDHRIDSNKFTLTILNATKPYSKDSLFFQAPYGAYAISMDSLKEDMYDLLKVAGEIAKK